MRLDTTGKLLSVIIPAYNEELMIQKAAETIHTILENEKIPHELLFVNDGSSDGTWGQISALSQTESWMKGICFSRNFGKEAAMFAGMYYAAGDCCVLIDCDLQHPPQKIVEMYRLWEQGYEVIEAVKTDRGKENPLHTLAAACFYSMISKATGMDMSRASDFKLLDRKAVTVLLNIREKNAFFRALSSWIGFRTTQVEFEVQERTAGTSKWSTMSLVRYAVSNISSFSTAPMQLVTLLGVVMLVFSVLLGISTLYDKFTGIAPEGFTTVIIVQLFTGSIIMMSLGLIGYYISRIYEEVKGRPRFVVAETSGEVEEKPQLS
ncbi:MAG: glycosyltransferase family 2 protein [Lachnospiraceae bacterium]|nr:glycosyltransferase family 2 protein [Lachnospiraceae bacterium]